MVDITILNANVATMDKKRRIIKDGAIVIRDDRIIDVDESGEIRSKYGEGGKVIDGSGMLAIPGLVNAHTHLWQALLRGLGDDLQLLDWLDEMVWPMNNRLEDEDVYAAALLGSVESIRTGTTFVVDNNHMNTSENSVDNVCKAFQETGMRGLVARGMFMKTPAAAKHYPDREYLPLDEEVKLTERLILKWLGKGEGRVMVCPGPANLRISGPDMLIEVKKLSDKYCVPIHTHIAESIGLCEWEFEDYKKRGVEFLYDLGVLGPRFHVVHGVWLDNREIKMMGETKANLIHCPVSNMFTASGVAPVPQLLAAGANVALGSDGVANMNQDMIGVMKTAALLHKVHTLVPTAMTCGQVLEMATLGGARAVGLEKEIGSIEVGKKADIVLVDLNKPHISPFQRAVPALVYCALGTDVDTVIINGKMVMEEGRIKTVDEKKIIKRAQERADSLIERAEMTHLINKPQFESRKIVRGRAEGGE